MKNDIMTKNFIDEMISPKEMAYEMMKIGKNYINSHQLEARLLADWIYRFGSKLKQILSNPVIIHDFDGSWSNANMKFKDDIIEVQPDHSRPFSDEV